MWSQNHRTSHRRVARRCGRTLIRRWVREHIAKIIETYQFRKEEARYSRRVETAEIEKNDFNLNISRYISTAVGEVETDLEATHGKLVEIEKTIAVAKHKHNDFRKELGLSPLP